MLKRNDVILKFADYLLPVIVITALVFACFYRTLGSYFVADDFGQIAYAGNIVKGDMQALVSNFTGSYMQCAVMKIYRPCLLLSFIFDYLLWKTNAFGYFLTDIVSLAGVAVMLYLLLRELTGSWGNARSRLLSLLSAALFASSPLHCESISFVSGRDNVISAFFYLLSSWCLIRNSRHKNIGLLAAGIAAFWIAIFSKEMAIGLPVLLFGIGLFFPEITEFRKSSPSSDNFALQKRFLTAIKLSFPIWISVVLYFVLRFFTLGTFFGGYTGSIGAALVSQMVQHWTDIDTLQRIAYPLNLELFGSISNYRAFLSTIYIALSALIAVRLISRGIPLKWLGFLSLWIFTTIAPLYQLWTLGLNLEGARFFFFLTIPLALVAPVLLLAPGHSLRNLSDTNRDAHGPEAIGVLTLIALVVLSTKITYINNSAWVAAGRQARAVIQEARNLARSTPSNRKLVVLGIPKELAGAHIIYNGATFNTMMSKPFSDSDYFYKFITFDPIFYGGAELINAQRLKRVLSQPDIGGFFVWNERSMKFKQLTNPYLKSQGTNPSEALICNPVHGTVTRISQEIPLTDDHGHRIVGNNYETWTAPLNLDPHKYDFLELACKTPQARSVLSVLWKGEANSDWFDSKHPVQTTANGRLLRARLSDHWRWYTEGKIKELQLTVLPTPPVTFTDVRLVSASELVPELTVANAVPSNIGVYAINKHGLSINFDASKLKDCRSVEIEISKPNFFFEGLSDREKKDATMTRLTQRAIKGELVIPRKTFISPAYYELRAHCLNDKGTTAGEYSDPITVIRD